MRDMKTIYQNNETEDQILDIDQFDPVLFSNFLTYWIIRKSASITSAHTVKELRSSNLSNWIDIIESNHRFKALYGEETANVIISLIEESE